jgi:hypothetical protein
LQGRYLHTEQHKYRINAHSHPCLKWDSNSRAQCSNGRRRFNALRCPYTYESGSRVRLGSGSNEPNSSVCGAPRAGLGSLLARTRVGGPEPGSRIQTAKLRSSHDRPVARKRRVAAIRASGVIAFRIAVSCFTMNGFTFASTSHILK